jgi:hypothetical protein
VKLEIRKTEASGCLSLALTLFVLCVLADDTHHATAVNDLALVTDFLY